jgi:voltage-gated potassium channel
MTVLASPGGRPALTTTLRYYYEGASPEAQRFRYALLAFDLVTVAFIVGTSSCRAPR